MKAAASSLGAEIGILDFPGIRTVSPTFLCRLVEMSLRHGWDPNGIALVISEESKFDPAVKNPDPRSTASGLIQFIEETARGLGTTTAAIRKMSAEEQLPLVERFFERNLKAAIPTRIEDYFLAVLGRSALIGASDDAIVFAKGSDAARSNPVVDLNKDGVITVGEARAYMRAHLNRAGGRVAARFPAICITPPTAHDGWAALAAIGAAALALGVGYGVAVIRGGR